MAHTVTLTKLPDGESDDYEYAFGGEHGYDCKVLTLCRRKACQSMNPDRGDERVRHGREHFYRDGEWLAVSDQCALRYVFEWVTEEETFAGIPLGTYPIHIQWDDEVWWIEVQTPRVSTEGLTA